MAFALEWPAPILDHFATYGPILDTEQLSGLSGAQVFRVRFIDGSVIVKASASETELAFYDRVARSLGRIGVATPRVEWSGRVDGESWLVLEDVPAALPKVSSDGWRAEPRVLETLCRLHNASPDIVSGLPERFEPRWTAEMNAAALTFFPAGSNASLAPVLNRVRHEAQPLFEPRYPISGDPNPANWGVRADGTAVLFDWERCGLGSPALDLAIIISGLGDEEIYRRLARDYCDVWNRLFGSPPWSVRDLAREIGVARVWVVVEFMAEYAHGGIADGGSIIDWLVDAVPPWLIQIPADSFSGPS